MLLMISNALSTINQFDEVMNGSDSINFIGTLRTLIAAVHFLNCFFVTYLFILV